MPSTGPKRSPQQRERDLELLSQWECEGLTQLEMTGRLNALRGPDGYTLTPQQVNRDVAELHRRARLAQAERVEAARAAHLAKLRHVWRTMWAEWYASRQPREISQSQRVTSAPGGGDGPGRVSDRATLRREQRQGDPRYIKLALAALAEEIKLLGTARLDELSAARLQQEAERIARELGLSVADVLAEAERIVGGGR
jgi:hypothetical protein